MVVTVQQQISIAPESIKLFVFDEVYSFRAAEEQAQKKKLNAFGLFAKLNPLKRPKDDTVELIRKESRYEPFWLVEATRFIDYSRQENYSLTIANNFAQSVQINDVNYDVFHNKDKASINITALENCHRKLAFDEYLDGLNRNIEQHFFKSIVQKYRYSEKETFENENILSLLLPQQAAIQKACVDLNKNIIEAHHISNDEISITKLHLFFIPVFAFEFCWTAADKFGVIEVNGLTGEIIEDGHWYKDKISGLITKQMLIDLGADIASEIVPGGGIAVRVAGRIADNIK